MTRPAISHPAQRNVSDSAPTRADFGRHHGLAPRFQQAPVATHADVTSPRPLARCGQPSIRKSLPAKLRILRRHDFTRSRWAASVLFAYAFDIRSGLIAEKVSMSRAGQAYEHIASEILKGRWHPGDILSTYALAEELKISRTPISEALKRLETDGLVEIIPQVGCRVSARPDRQLITELCALCGALAGLAAESAALSITADQLKDLEAVVAETEQSAGVKDTNKAVNLNHQFYLKIAEASAMPRLLQISRGMWSLLRHQLLGYPFTEELTTELLMESAQQQRAIFDALKRPAGDDARTLCERHVRSFGPRFADSAACAVPKAAEGENSSMTGEKGKE